MLFLKQVFHKGFGIYSKHPKDWYRKRKKSFSSSEKFDLGGYGNEEGPLWQEKQASALPLGVTAWTKSCQRMLTLYRCFYENIDVWVFSFNFYFYIILLYNTVLVLPYIDMNPPQVCMRSQHEPSSHLPPHNISLGHPRAPALGMLYPASGIGWLYGSLLQEFMKKAGLEIPVKVKIVIIILSLCVEFWYLQRIFINITSVFSK